MPTTKIDLGSPSQVFERLSQIHMETGHRRAQIERLEDEQHQADVEHDDLERVAVAYLCQHPDCAVTVQTWDGFTSREWSLHEQDGLVVVRPRVLRHDFTGLSAGEVEALLASEDAELQDAKPAACACDGRCDRDLSAIVAEAMLSEAVDSLEEVERDLRSVLVRIRKPATVPVGFAPLPDDYPGEKGGAA